MYTFPLSRIWYRVEPFGLPVVQVKLPESSLQLSSVNWLQFTVVFELEVELEPVLLGDVELSMKIDRVVSNVDPVQVEIATNPS